MKMHYFITVLGKKLTTSAIELSPGSRSMCGQLLPYGGAFYGHLRPSIPRLGRHFWSQNAKGCQCDDTRLVPDKLGREHDDDYVLTIPAAPQSITLAGAGV